ncbi:acyl-CoA dehydrogenase family protein [Streptomyces sp. NPDC021098]|uniref:acyl-CoA dehydrogenase family protein n=1 Tax=unclassified Streptomyces TaxID=2593676 RepID=UPI0037A1BC8A
MDFAFGTGDERFRSEARTWLDAHLTGHFTDADADADADAAATDAADATTDATTADAAAQRAWERELGDGGWIGLGWDRTHGTYGNRAATLTQQVVWAEEYARAGAPARLGHIGENLLAPTLLAHGDPAQRARFLPPIARGEELWCQGYSEPDAGSDLAGLRTRADRDPGDGTYRVTGQKIWTSHAREADWCFVLARTEQGSQRHHGLSFLLVPMDQPGRVEVRPIRQLTGTAEFNEVFFEGALAHPDHLVGGPGQGWSVAMSLLAVERGVSTLVQQIGFAQELDRVIRQALETGAAREPVLRDQLIRQWAELKVMRWNALRTLGTAARAPAPGGPTPTPSPPASHLPAAQDAGAPSVAKLLWGGWHRRLGELAVQVRGAAAALGPVRWTEGRPYELDAAQRLFLFSRADTIYGGSDEIQRNIIAERVLHLPKESQ